MTFAPEALDFLRRLEANNERGWFHARRDEYDRLLLEPARDFVEAFGELSGGLGEGIDADPRVGRSIMRINRDTPSHAIRVRIRRTSTSGSRRARARAGNVQASGSGSPRSG